MKDLFYMGGPLFMGILTVIFILMLAWAIYQFIPVILRKDVHVQKILHRLVHIKSIGLFALVTGILGQLIGLYMAFSAIERAADISPAIIYGGLKVSMITTFYGILIYLLSLLLWFILDYLASKKL